MDILQQSLAAADIAVSSNSEQTDDLLLELSNIEPVTNNDYANQSFNCTNTTVNDMTTNFNNNTQLQNPSMVLQQKEAYNSPMQQNTVNNNLNNVQQMNQNSQPRIISYHQPNKVQQISINNQMQNQNTSSPKTQQVMLVASTQSQQNGVYQLVNVQQQQQGNRTIVPIKPMLLQQSNVNGRYVVSPLNVKPNIVVPSQIQSQNVSSSFNQTSMTTTTTTLGQRVSTCQSVFSKPPSQIVTTTPSSSLFASKLPPGIRVVHNLLPTKGDTNIQQNSTNNTNTMNVTRKIVSYPSGATKVVTINNNNIQNNSGVIGVQLNQNQQTIQLIVST